MRSRLFVYLLLGMFLSCTTKPSYVLSDKKMENVLLDLYIVEAGMNENARIFYNDSTKKQDLLESVFKKHKVSQAKFDTSLVWYNSQLKRYLKINAQVTERYDHWIDKLQAEIQKAKNLLGNNIRFEDLELQNFFPFWLTDVLTVPIIHQDTMMSDPEKICRFERICFYEDVIMNPPEAVDRFERISFYEEE